MRALNSIIWDKCFRFFFFSFLPFLRLISTCSFLYLVIIFLYFSTLHLPKTRKSDVPFLKKKSWTSFVFFPPFFRDFTSKKSAFKLCFIFSSHFLLELYSRALFSLLFILRCVPAIFFFCLPLLQLPVSLYAILRVIISVRKQKRMINFFNSHLSSLLSTNGFDAAESRWRRTSKRIRLRNWCRLSVTIHKYYKIQWHLITKNYDYQSTFATGIIVKAYLFSPLQPSPSVTVFFFFSIYNYENE